MTTELHVGSGATHGGTVFDIGYQSYTGTREGRMRPRIAIFKDGVRIALGLGRSPRAKILPWFFIGLLSFIAIIMALIIGAAERMGGPEASANLPSHLDYYGIASILLFLFGAMVAPELLCRDRREGTINLYLVRPLTGTDYVAARWAAFMAVITVAAWLPQVILFLALTLDHPSPWDYLQANWLDVPRFLAAGLALAAYTTTLALLTASFTTRRALASVFLVGLFIITTPFTTGLAAEIGGTTGQWISMFNLTSIPLHVSDVIFGELSELTEALPASTLPDSTKLLWFAAWVLSPGAVLWWRYRRLTP